MKRLAIAAALVALLCGAAPGADYKPVTPTAKDKCPVCGMFVAKYPDFVAQVIYRDGASAVFDGAKDLFKYLLNLRAYAPSRQASDIGAIYVTDYYSLTPVDGRGAWYVLGSDVYGPMGRELIPFGKETEAKEFMTDHKGKRLLRFGEVTADVLKGLD
ncbi:MAG TPA: nitrous oxide reductase accessory protein NosL [Candidatus Methylomirabilis sp.]|nr:nitrous oxide reductase accessory protein NosL [Candidatus Methylomirabilis sp.]